VYVCVCVATHESLSFALTSSYVVSAGVHSTETDMSREKYCEMQCHYLHVWVWGP